MYHGCECELKKLERGHVGKSATHKRMGGRCEGDGAVLAVSSEKGFAQLSDARTGGLLRTLQDCHPCAGGLAATSSCVMTAEKNRSFVHLWSWNKEQPQYRCQAPERLSCIYATADGAHCVAGAGSGKLYLWQVASGKLLYTWDAHFRPVTALSATCADGYLLSAGEDAIINVWSFAQLLRAAEAAAPAPRPFRTWTAHTLSVTALAVAHCGHNSLVVSSSLDQTVRVWRMAEDVKESVHGADLGAALTCVAVDPNHAAVYAGAADGRVLYASLLIDASELLRPGGPTQRAGPAAGGEAGEAGSGARAGLARHAAAVSAVCISSDGIHNAAPPHRYFWYSRCLSPGSLVICGLHLVGRYSQTVYISRAHAHTHRELIREYGGLTPGSASVRRPSVLHNIAPTPTASVSRRGAWRFSSHPPVFTRCPRYCAAWACPTGIHTTLPYLSR